MTRRLWKRASLPCCMLALLIMIFVLSGCGGGGGAGVTTVPAGTLLSVSFVGYFPTPGIPPNANTNLPTVFRDQALEFRFNGPVDNPVLGGFFSQNGAPVEFLGVPPAGSMGIPYYAYDDQTAAHNALQIRLNVAGAAVQASYVVGRHRDKPDTIVMDPRVPNGSPLGLPVSFGLAASSQYVFIIPAGSALTFGGQPVLPAGSSLSALPVIVPPFSTQPVLGGLFQTSLGFGPNPNPPAVVSITPQSGHAGTSADPMLLQDAIVVTFSQLVTTASLDPLKNFIVRNTNATNTTYPQGIPVPGSVTPQNPGASADVAFIFTPAAPYGPGTGGHGFDIEVRIGDIPYPQPNNVVPPILGVPTGLSGTQLELSNSLSAVLRADPCTGCQTPASIVEGFDNSIQLDPTFVPTFGPAQPRWNHPTAPSQLAGRIINGSPSGNTPVSLGTRVQFVIDPLPNNVAPAGLFSPFDASTANSGSQCGIQGCNLGPGINPGGGSHIMHEYEFGEGTPSMNIKDSLEQIEWSPTTGVTAQTVYPQCSIWCGLTNTPAPISGGAAQGLTSVYDANYNLTPYQSTSPLSFPIAASCAAPGAVNPRKVPCGLGQAYTVLLQTTQFYPFPVLNPPFDYATSTGVSGVGVNLLYEVNIEPGMQAPNFNRYRATSFQPVRRLIDKPISLVPANICPFNNGGTFDIYKTRFTFVGLVSQARSLWYDTGSPDPTYLNFILTPPVTSQPFGTASTWLLEGTDAPNPGPGTNGSLGVYIDYPAGPNGGPVVHPTVLSSTINQLRYFRFRVEMRANNVANTTPAYASVVMAYTF